MAINPFRIGELNLPSNYPKPPALDFSGIGELGAGIGRYREEQDVSNILKSAVGPDGNLDWNKAATALAVTGRDPSKFLNALMQQQTLAQHAQTQKSLDAYHAASLKQAADIAKENADLRRQELEQGKTSEFSIEDPLGLKPATRYRYSPNIGTKQVFPPPPEPVVPGPRSDVPALAPGNVAAVNPEEGPPYRVAGPPVPAPTAATEPVLSGRDLTLQNFAKEYGPDAATIFRDVLDYKRGLPHDDKIKQRWITAARQIDPTFDPTRFEEQSKKPTENESKFTMYANRALRAEQVMRMPDVLAAGMDFGQRTMGAVPFVGNYMVNPSFQRYDQAARDLINAFLRPESGAAIGQSEFNNAYKQYMPQPNDSPQVLKDKQDAREKEIAGIIAGAGRNFVPSHTFEGGKMVPNPKATDVEAVLPTVRPVKNEAETNAIVAKARAALKRDPTADDEIVRMLEERKVPNARRLLLGR